MKYQRCKIFVFDLIAVFGFFLTALGTYLTIRSDKTIGLIHDELLLGCGGITFVCIVGWYYYFHWYHLLVSVLEGRDSLSDAHLKIQEYSRIPMRKSKVQEHLLYLSEICQCISIAFKKYHSPAISVCIHYLNRDATGRYYVKVLSRNTDSKDRLLQAPPPGKETDYVDDNTDFKKLIEKVNNLPPGKVYYLNNFLPFSPCYKNSHFSKKAQQRYYAWYGFFLRALRWELPYKSTMVVPIMTGHHVAGFLAVDSPGMWAFSSIYDLPALQSVAKSLAPYLDNYNSLNLASAS